MGREEVLALGRLKGQVGTESFGEQKRRGVEYDRLCGMWGGEASRFGITQGRLEHEKVGRGSPSPGIKYAQGKANRQTN